LRVSGERAGVSTLPLGQAGEHLGRGRGAEEKRRDDARGKPTGGKDWQGIDPARSTQRDQSVKRRRRWRKAQRNPEVRAQLKGRLNQLLWQAGGSPGGLATDAGFTAEFTRRVLAGAHDVRVSALLKFARALGLEVRRTRRDPKTGQLLEPRCLCAVFEPVEKRRSERPKSSVTVVAKALAVKEA
jgi:hypothetical protein